MARNEEKQLARLNRLYLQQQKEEELKKRPPRPKLETLNSADGVKKWIPTIMRDIDFYIKQMEVPCYPKDKIEEFECRIDHLRGEYKAFLRKLHQLEPDLKTTPWSDRPYAVKRKKTEACQVFKECESDTRTLEGQSMIKDLHTNDSVNLQNFIPVSTPVLKKDSFYLHCYGFEKPKVSYLNEVVIQMQDEPLQFDFGKRSLDCTKYNVDTRATYSCDGKISCGEVKIHSQSCITDESGDDRGAYDQISIKPHVNHSKQEVKLTHGVSEVNNKTSRLSPHRVLYSEDTHGVSEVNNKTSRLSPHRILYSEDTHGVSEVNNKTSRLSPHRILYSKDTHGVSEVNNKTSRLSPHRILYSKDTHGVSEVNNKTSRLSPHRILYSEDTHGVIEVNNKASRLSPHRILYSEDTHGVSEVNNKTSRLSPHRILYSKDTHGVSEVNNKTSRLSAHRVLYSKDQEKCFSDTSNMLVQTGDGNHVLGGTIENTKLKDNDIPSRNGISSEISLLGTLNIPYTDSSSSDDET